MTCDELIGKVAAGYLRDRLSEDDSLGVARYLIDCLTADQTAAVLISSTAPLSLLRSMVFGRVKDLNLELNDAECRELTEKFINDANEISGDIVLRAAKRGRNASELMGVVLSRYMIRHELGRNRRFGWYFLDDYAEWLGQREEQIADILAITPEQMPDGSLQLAVIIAESKYIDAASVATKRKESQKQLRDTVRRINDAIFGDPKRLDRDLWLSRFSDLMLNGIQFPANSPIDLAAWRRAVRDGQCAIHMRGYSHIFVSGPSDSAECSDFVAVAEAEQSYQEVFSRAKLRELVLSYWKDSNPTSIRKTVAGEDIWQEQIYRKPSDRVQIVQRRKPDDDSSSAGGKPEDGDGKKPKPKPTAPSSTTTTPMSTTTKAGQQNTAATTLPSSWAYSKVSQLLADYQGGTQDSAADTEWLKQVENLCKGALQQFQLQSKLLNSALTPNAALLKFQGSANLTVEQVLRRRSEFLTTHIRISRKRGVLPSVSWRRDVAFRLRFARHSSPPSAPLSPLADRRPKLKLVEANLISPVVASAVVSLWPHPLGRRGQLFFRSYMMLSASD
jgi:S-DNA-T family DNA segregation ATPase FtsK/SpoIIIE